MFKIIKSSSARAQGLTQKKSSYLVIYVFKSAKKHVMCLNNLHWKKRNISISPFDNSWGEHIAKTFIPSYKIACHHILLEMFSIYLSCVAQAVLSLTRPHQAYDGMFLKYPCTTCYTLCCKCMTELPSSLSLPVRMWPLGKICTEK